jgi:hypothetical protein
MREPDTALHAVSTVAERDYVEFWPAGTVAAGRFRCAACGIVTDVKFVLPSCQECGQRLWERAESSGYAEVAR